jgi:hypothetical protein
MGTQSSQSKNPNSQKTSQTYDSQSTTKAKARVPTPLIKQTRHYIQTLHTPLPRQQLNLLHHLKNINNLIIKNPIITSLPNHPNHRMPNQPHPSSKLFVPHMSRPTNSMNK